MKAHTPIRLLRDERGFTLIELLVAMVVGMIVSLAAFSLLQFTTEDVSLTTERAHVTQMGRTGLEKIMLKLHSTCVDGEGNYHPIKAGSNGSELKFISETSPVNSEGQPTSSLSTVHLRKIIFKNEALIEKSWLNKGSASKYEFNESESPTEATLLKGVSETEVGGKKLPIFQYYRYYESTDTIPTGHSSIPYGELYPKSLETSELTSETTAAKVAKVTVAFTLAPEGKESIFDKGHRPVNLEDSAVFSLEPSSENSGDPNFPCNET
jgi:prepilin-type N-terminal cleavage/methylation domain-containing protein